MSSLFVFPFIFSFLSSNDVVIVFKKLKIYFWIYIIAISLFNVVPFLWYLITQDTLGEIIRHYPRVIIIDYGKYAIHPIYISMHTCIAILFSIYLFRETKLKLHKIVLSLLIITLITFLLIYLRKGPVIALIVTLVVWSFFELKKHLKHNLLFIGTLVTLFIIIPKTRNRFLELTNIEAATSENASSTNIRYTIFNNSIDLIKGSPFIGFGIGDYNTELKKTFVKNVPFLLGKTYNSHNQFLSFILIGGMGLLLLFLFFYYKNLRIALNQNNILLVLILVFYGVMMFFENVLERENGVIFIAFFINFFALKNYTNFEE
jgi:O-antigen ligase